jgi:hypothetical protein
MRVDDVRLAAIHLGLFADAGRTGPPWDRGIPPNIRLILSMATRFAGSRFLDERRRRRLAVDSVPTADRPVRTSRKVPEQTEIMPNPNEPTTTGCTLESLIPSKTWKHWIVIGLLLSSGAGILWAAYFDLHERDLAGPGFARLFALSSGKVACYFSTILLTLAGQFALVIRRVRSLSESDFAGHYRCWGWAAAVWFVFGFAAATDAHWAWSETVLRFSGVLAGIEIWNRDVWCWLAPAVAVWAVTLWVLHRDMCECRSSLTLLWLSAFVGLLTAAHALGIEIAGLDREHNQLIGLGLAMLGHLCLFGSMSLHVRHVLYESHDPPDSDADRPEPAVATGTRSPLLPIRIPWPWLRRQRQSATAESTTKTETTEKPAAKPGRARKTATKTQQADAPAVSAPAAAGDESNKQATTTTTAAAKPRIRIDPPAKANEPDDHGVPDLEDDKESFKGLSKRERRELQKKRREEQRAGRNG